MIKRLVFFLSVLICGVGYWWYSSFVCVTYHGDFSQLDRMCSNDPTKSIVLLVATCRDAGGKVNATLAQYQAFYKNNIPVLLLTDDASVLVQQALEARLPVVSCRTSKFSYKNFMWAPGLQAAIASVFKRYAITVINTCSPKEVVVARNCVAKKTGIKIVYTHHGMEDIPSYVIKFADGLILVNKLVAEKMQALKQDAAVWIPPFYSERVFVPSDTVEQRKDFFKKDFGIECDTLPVLLMVGQFYGLIEPKNHLLLLKALALLVHNYRLPVHIVFAGDGSELAECKQLAVELSIDSYTHFLGFTNRIGELLFYSDGLVVPSVRDVFPLVVIEAGLMKKPVIVSSAVGSVGSLVVHNQTGLVFASENIRECAEQIIYLLSHPKIAAQLGDALYQEIVQHFSQDSLVNQTVNFYNKI